MKEKIDAIFAELKATIESGANLEPIPVPDIEPELIPFIVRELTTDEWNFLNAKVRAQLASNKMVARLELLMALGQEENMEASQKEDELIRFKASFLTDLFFRYIQEATNWKFSTITERKHEGKVVLVGLSFKDANAYYDRKEAETKLAQAPASTLVN